MTPPLIAFLDQLGRTPQVPDFEARVAALAVDAPTRAALIGRDPEELKHALGTTAALWCLISAPENEPNPTEDAPGDEPDREPLERPDPDQRPGSDPTN